MPGEFQFGNSVKVFFGNAGVIKNASITKAHFDYNCFETYDLSVLKYQDDDGTGNYQRLYNIPRGIIQLAPHDYRSQLEIQLSDMEELCRGELPHALYLQWVAIQKVLAASKA